ncbi:hypothetical protein ACEQ8H_001323 [Pleosporales sp. CAS-2024a]
MAELGLAASIIQITGAGAKLSLALYHFTTSAVHADQNIADIARDVELTSNALESVSKVFETEDIRSMVSKKAIADANNLIRRCEAVFQDITELIDKRRKVSKNGIKSLGVMGKFLWPMKEQTVELHRKRLESLKNSLVLLLHVLQLAQGQARGYRRSEKAALEREREKIRELHQRQQESLNCLQALEMKLRDVAIKDDVALRDPAAVSQTTTLNRMPDAPSHGASPARSLARQAPFMPDTMCASAVEPDTSDIEITGVDDKDEHISPEQLAVAARNVENLLFQIRKLQSSFDAAGSLEKYKKKRVDKMYRSFCRQWDLDFAMPKVSHTGFSSAVPISFARLSREQGYLDSSSETIHHHRSVKRSRNPSDDELMPAAAQVSQSFYRLPPPSSSNKKVIIPARTRAEHFRRHMAADTLRTSLPSLRQQSKPGSGSQNDYAGLEPKVHAKLPFSPIRSESSYIQPLHAQPRGQIMLSTRLAFPPFPPASGHSRVVEASSHTSSADTSSSEQVLSNGRLHPEPSITLAEGGEMKDMCDSGIPPGALPGNEAIPHADSGTRDTQRPPVLVPHSNRVASRRHRPARHYSMAPSMPNHFDDIQYGSTIDSPVPSNSSERDIVDILLDQWTVPSH